MIKIAIKYLLAALVLLTTISCKRDTGFVLHLDHLNSNRIFLEYSYVGDPNQIFYDTIEVENLPIKYSIKEEVSSPILLKMTCENDLLELLSGKMYWRKAYTIRYYLRPFEQAKIYASYQKGYIDYKIKGSKFLKHQSQTRGNTIGDLVELDKIQKDIDFIYQNYSTGFKKYSDIEMLTSAFKYMAATRAKVGFEALPYIKENPNDLLSALYLLEQSNVDTFLFYEENVLGVKARHLNILEERITTQKKAYQKKKLKNINAQAVLSLDKAPNFTLKQVGREDSISLYDIKSKFIVLNFWGTWCPYCIKDIPRLKEYYSKHRDKMEILGVCCRDIEARVEEKIKEYQMDWKLLMNTTEENKEVDVLYGVSNYPTKIILDSNYKIQKIFLGECDEFFSYLDEIL